MIELVWDATCPNIDDAREAIAAALRTVQQPIRWGEWDVNAPTTPPELRGFGSPTVLVAGRDIAGAEPAGAPCCRVYQAEDGAFLGVPEPQAIVAALLDSAAPPGRRAIPYILTQHLIVRLAGPDDAPLIRDYHERNEARLSAFNPARPAGFFELDAFRRRLEDARSGFLGDACALFIAFRRGNPERVVAEANYRNFVRGAFHACHLGYSVDGESEGQGLMQETLEATIAYAFDELGLHRIMANYLPENERSGALLERLGFEQEGFARDYLQIAGAWRDHVLTAKVNPNWAPPTFAVR